jgi:small subunit ribosomal protein S18
MAKKPARGARSRDANPRKFKKKTSPLVIEKVEYVDYKDVDLLTRFMSDRGKIRNQKITGNDVQQQREVANAIKIAREMGLLPYARRVASASRGRPGRDGDRRPRRDEQVEDQNIDAVNDEGIDESTESDALETVGAEDGEA